MYVRSTDMYFATCPPIYIHDMVGRSVGSLVLYFYYSPFFRSVKSHFTFSSYVHYIDGIYQMDRYER